MAFFPELDFSELFTVTRCRNPDYCFYCNKLIKQGQIKVTYKSKIYHHRCIEEEMDWKVTVNTEKMKVFKSE